MAPILYTIPHSPPVRAVLITAKALRLEVDDITLDLAKKENFTPEYLKLNPQHTVPTLVDDDGFSIWESHAINTYLVSKYGKNDDLYPEDLKKRAIINQRLHFDSGVAFAKGLEIVRAILRAGKTSIDDKDVESLNEVYEFLEAFLEGKEWMAGDSKTIADYSLYTITTSLDVLVKIDGQKYPKLVTWVKKVGELKEVEVSKPGLAVFERVIRSRLG